MRFRLLLIAAVAVFAAAGCGSQGGGAFPITSIDGLHSTVPAIRGKIAFYEDTFGDASLDGIVTGPDDAIWFTDPGNDVIGRITAHGKYTLQQAVGGAELSDGITVGPDNNLWFTLESGGIGRMHTDGTFTTFHDSAGSFPQGITTGPDGALWFAQSGGGVGRITTQGTITHFTVAAANADLEGIVTGPDGNLWVTEAVDGSRFSNHLIRVTPNGAHKSFTVGSGPTWICVGPDKALWFTERAANAIGRLTVKGNYKEYPTHVQNGGPSGIAVGPDKALWFSDFNGAFGIGRITMSGKVSFYHAPSTGSELRQIIRGPDGAMWFSSYLGVPGVGRITTHL